MTAPLYRLYVKPNSLLPFAIASSYLKSGETSIAYVIAECDPNAVDSAKRRACSRGFRAIGPRDSTFYLRPPNRCPSWWSELVSVAAQVPVREVVFDTGDMTAGDRAVLFGELERLGFGVELAVKALGLGLGDQVEEAEEVEEAKGEDIPPHYAHCTIEPLDFILGAVDDPLAYIKGNIIKYAARAGHKVSHGQSEASAAIDDLQKIIAYASAGISYLDESEEA